MTSSIELNVYRFCANLILSLNRIFRPGVERKTCGKKQGITLPKANYICSKQLLITRDHLNILRYDKAKVSMKTIMNLQSGSIVGLQ